VTIKVSREELKPEKQPVEHNVCSLPQEWEEIFSEPITAFLSLVC
jgi:hypothetical protein